MCCRYQLTGEGGVAKKPRYALKVLRKLVDKGNTLAFLKLSECYTEV